MKTHRDNDKKSVQEDGAEQQVLSGTDEPRPAGWVWESYGETHFTADINKASDLEEDGISIEPVYRGQPPQYRG